MSWLETSLVGSSGKAASTSSSAAPASKVASASVDQKNINLVLKWTTTHFKWERENFYIYLENYIELFHLFIIFLKAYQENIFKVHDFLITQQEKWRIDWDSLRVSTSFNFTWTKVLQEIYDLLWKLSWDMTKSSAEKNEARNFISHINLLLIAHKKKQRITISFPRPFFSQQRNIWAIVYLQEEKLKSFLLTWVFNLTPSSRRLLLRSSLVNFLFSLVLSLWTDPPAIPVVNLGNFLMTSSRLPWRLNDISWIRIAFWIFYALFSLEIVQRLTNSIDLSGGLGLTSRKKLTSNFLIPFDFRPNSQAFLWPLKS